MAMSVNNFTSVVEKVINLARTINETNVSFLDVSDVCQTINDLFDEQIDTQSDYYTEEEMQMIIANKNLLETYTTKYEEDADKEGTSRMDTNYCLKKVLLEQCVKMINEFDLDIDVNSIVSSISQIPENESCNLIISMDPTDKSPKRGWKRAYAKYNPSKLHLLSPVKPTIANYASVLFNDEYNDGLLWILNMSEKLYYDNSCLLGSKLFSEPNIFCNTLRMNTQEIQVDYLMNTWIRMTYLGAGSFGIVLKVITNTKETQAVKYVKRNHDFTIDFLSFVTERNYLIRASNSPFVVRILYTFQLTDLPGLFLVMEYCISDLRQLLKSFRKTFRPNSYLALVNRNKKYFEKLYEDIDAKYNLDIKKLFSILIFELFAILDHLAECKIVHRDLKPENIMISDQYHLKVGDLGLVNNTYHITECNRSKLFNYKNVLMQQLDKYAPVFQGTPLYRDPEVSFYKMPPNIFKDAFRGMDDVHDMLDEDNTQNFLYDLWAIGQIAAEFLLAGFNLFDPQEMNQYPDINFRSANSYPCQFLMLLFTIVPIYHQHIEPGLEQTFNGIMGELPKFIGSILNYRSKRCPDYLKIKSVLIYNRQEVYKCIDLEKVKQIDMFRKYSITERNAFLFTFPDEFKKFISETNKDGPVIERFDEIIEELKQQEDRNKYEYGYCKLQPGINLIIEK